MEKNLITQDQFKMFVDQAPKGIDPVQLAQKFIDDGYVLQGYNDKATVNPNGATFRATGDEGVVGGALKTLGNVPSSTFNLGKNVVSAVTHPVRTGKAIVDLTKGLGGKIAELGLENTEIGQRMLQQANERGQNLETKDGKLQAKTTDDVEKFDQLLDFFKSRYGSTDNFKQTVIEDPVGVLSDIATLVTGAGAAVKGAGTAGKIAEVSKVGQAVQTFGGALEPVNALGKASKTLAKTARNTVAGDVAADIVPTATRVQQGQVAKALGMSAGDLRTISQKTGNNAAEFIIKNDVVKNTPDETALAIKDLRTQRMNEVRTNVASVTNEYTPDQIPRFRDGLNEILSEVDGIKGLEDEATEIKALLQKENYTLSDVQRGKELFDDAVRVYNNSGDVKAGNKARGLDNIRREMKEFIESEVDNFTEGAVDIRKLNNDVQTAYGIEDSINKRALNDLPRQYANGFTVLAGLGGATAFNPLVGIGIVIGKKIVETPAFRLAFARALQARPVKNINRIAKEVLNKTVSESSRKVLQEIVDEARQNMQVIESGSAAINQVESTK